MEKQLLRLEKKLLRLEKNILRFAYMRAMIKKKKQELENEYQSILDTEISENEELRKIVKENEKWDRIAELG